MIEPIHLSRPLRARSSGAARPHHPSPMRRGFVLRLLRSRTCASQTRGGPSSAELAPFFAATLT
ncbi:hypothetical protein A1351_06180 [Methylosinus sp. R-45379]|nr:hypothetical protein A1351_06180 [Methylosinus sp. R-45379]